MKHRLRRSWLYVPADKREWYERLASYDADVLVIDLEDAVGEAKKDLARQILVEEASECTAFERMEFFVRINAVDSIHFPRDIETVRTLSPVPVGIVLPKVTSANEIKDLGNRLKGSSMEIVPVIELLEAEFRVGEIIGASDRIASVQFAESGDYSLDYGRFGKTLDAMGEPVARDFAIHVLKACKRLRKSVIDGAYLDIKDREGLRKRCEWAFDIGFDGKAALHPDQVPVINQAFSADAEKIELAREMVRLYEEKVGSEAFVPYQGSFITPPKYEAARQFLKKQGR